MHIKDMQYYRDFDLNSAASQIEAMGDSRGKSEIFADAITSITVRCMTDKLPESQIRRVLGQPNKIRQVGSKTIWDYEWEDVYADVPYESSTPLVIVDGYCVGVDDE